MLHRTLFCRFKASSTSTTSTTSLAGPARSLYKRPFLPSGRLQPLAARRFPFLMVRIAHSDGAACAAFVESNRQLIERMLCAGVDMIHLSLLSGKKPQQGAAAAAAATATAEDDAAFVHAAETLQAVVRRQFDNALLFVDHSSRTCLPESLRCAAFLPNGSSAVKLQNLRTKFDAGSTSAETEHLQRLPIGISIRCPPIGGGGGSVASALGGGASLGEKVKECAINSDLFVLDCTAWSSAVANSAPSFALDEDAVKEAAVHCEGKPVLLHHDDGLHMQEQHLERAMQLACSGVSAPIGSFVGKRAPAEELVAGVKNALKKAGERYNRKLDPRNQHHDGVAAARQLPDKWRRLLNSKGTTAAAAEVTGNVKRSDLEHRQLHAEAMDPTINIRFR